MFSFFKEKLTKVYSQFSSKLGELFGRSTIDQATIQDLSRILLSADTGVKTTKNIIAQLEKALVGGGTISGAEAKKVLEKELLALLPENKKPIEPIVLLVGVNGSGKTTSTGKLAYFFKHKNEQVLVAAADTFRAAAVDQVKIWAERAGVLLYAGTPNQDPAAVVFGACREFKEKKYNRLIIDTAGRLQTKNDLMRELEKIRRSIEKQLPGVGITTILVVDSILGQNSLNQAMIFNESTKLDGLILTKMDGTSKGGIVFSICQELKIPVLFISAGEKIEDLQQFSATDYVNQLLGS